MLETLHVKNLAIIDESEVELSNGLNILTGETGAGKSIIIGSVNLALGEKANKDFIRRGAEFALVELTFYVQSEEVKNALKELDLFTEDDRLTLSRRLMENRSICKINGESVSLSVMKKAAELLIDVHGQHETQSLLYRKNHILLLDRYAHESITDLLELYQDCYREYLTKLHKLEEFSLDETNLEKEKNFLEFQISEIEDAKLILGEDDELEKEYRLLSNNQKIMEALSAAYQNITSDGAGSEVSRACREVSSVANYDPEISSIAKELEDAETLLSEVEHHLDQYISHNSYDEDQFRICENRLNEINHLKSKYGHSIDTILKTLDELKQNRDKLDNYEKEKTVLEKDINAKKEQLFVFANQLTEARKSAACFLANEITKSLEELNFIGSEFEIRIEQTEEFGVNGRDAVYFMIATNPGEELKPLEKIASGGELSRIMLALISVCAENDQMETLIFDEIDSGVSGRTAQKVAEKLNLIARSHQVICITHLPQIASFADSHYAIEKVVSDDDHGPVTVSSIRKLNENDSIGELARLLGGARITDAVLKNAEEMKSMAVEQKKSKKTIA